MTDQKSEDLVRLKTSDSTTSSFSSVSNSISKESNPKEVKDKKKITSYSNLKNFLSGFPIKDQESLLTGSSSYSENGGLLSPTSPISPPEGDFVSLKSLPYNNSSNDFNTPLLASFPTSDSVSIINIKPTTTIEILQLDPEEIKKIFDQAIIEAKHSRSAGDKAYLGLLLSIAIGAVLIEPLFSSFVQLNIQTDCNYWFTEGHPTNPTPRSSNASFGLSWGLAVINCIIDIVSVNPLEEAFALFNQKWPGWLEKLKNIRENFGRWMFNSIAFAGLFLPVYAIQSAADMTGLTNVAHKDSPGFVISSGVSLVVLGLGYFCMFSYGQFEKHLDALIGFCFDLTRSIKGSSTPAPNTLLDIAPTKKHSGEIKNKEKDPLNTYLAKIAAYLEMERINLSNCSFRGLYTLIVLAGIIHNTMHKVPSTTTAIALLCAGAFGFVTTGLTRYLQVFQSFINPEFKQLTSKQIKEAKVGLKQRLIDTSMALTSGGPLAAFTYRHGFDNNAYAAILAGGLGTLFSLVTWTGSNYRSKREAALQAIQDKKSLNVVEEIVSSSSAAQISRLDEVLAMSPSEVFDQIVIRSKSGWLNDLSGIFNTIARTGRVFMFGGFIANTVELLKSYGIEVEPDFIDQILITMFFGVATQRADLDVYHEALVGKPDDAEGYIPYLSAKHKIGDLFWNFLTPKQNYNYVPLFKTLCKLDEDLHDAFMASKASLTGTGLELDEDKLIHNLQLQVKQEYGETIERLARWVGQESEAQSVASLQNIIEFAPLIKILQSTSLDSRGKQDFGFTGKDYQTLKDIEYAMFQEKMYRAMNTETDAIGISNLENAAIILTNKHLTRGNYLISQEALSFIERLEQVHSVSVASSDLDKRSETAPGTNGFFSKPSTTPVPENGINKGSSINFLAAKEKHEAKEVIDTNKRSNRGSCIIL